MKERLELVREFGELRTGMIVVIDGASCGCRHRGILLSQGGGVCDKAAFSVAPPRGNCGLLVEACECAVRNKHVFRIDTGLESSDDYRETISVDEQLAKVRARQRRKERTR